MSLIPVVMVAYYFPPQGGAGTQRFAKFAKWLPSCGYRPIVVTAAASTSSKSAPISDSSLLSEVGEQTIIVRVPENRPVPRSPWRRLKEAGRFVLDDEAWVARAESVVIQAVREYSAAAVIITVSPYAAAALGERVSETCGIPWLLDLRDPWALDGWRQWPTLLHAMYDLRCMKRALQRADLVIANTPGSRLAYLDLAHVPEERVWTIPNGFDTDDFEITPSRHDKFTLVHVGTLHSVEPQTRRSVKGMLRKRWCEIEETGRSGRYLYEAIGHLKQTRRDLYDLLQVELYGCVHATHRPLARRLGIEEAVLEKGYVPHRDSIAAMCAGDAVFVPLHVEAEGQKALIVPGKIYEALASERYVLGCLPQGDAASLIQLTQAGTVCPPNDPVRIAQVLTELIEAWRAGLALRGAFRSQLVPFTRQSLAARLAQALDSLLAREPAARPADPWEELAGRVLPAGMPGSR